MAALFERRTKLASSRSLPARVSSNSGATMRSRSLPASASVSSGHSMPNRGAGYGNCWHGNTFQALQRLESLLINLEFPETPSDLTRKIAKVLGEFQTYISNNEEFIPNFGERRRNGELISTAFVESTVNQVISKRMVKKQQMRWTQRGAHLLLQIRTKVLNNELEEVFRHWYPQFRAASASAPAF